MKTSSIFITTRVPATVGFASFTLSTQHSPCVVEYGEVEEAPDCRQRHDDRAIRGDLRHFPAQRCSSRTPGSDRCRRGSSNVDGQMHASPEYTIPLHALAQTPKSAILALWALSARWMLALPIHSSSRRAWDALLAKSFFVILAKLPWPASQTAHPCLILGESITSIVLDTRTCLLTTQQGQQSSKRRHVTAARSLSLKLTTTDGSSRSGVCGLNLPVLFQ